jgi:hypothetical protein
MTRNERVDGFVGAEQDGSLHLTDELAGANVQAEREHSHRNATPLARRRIPTFEQYVKTLPLDEQAKIRRAERDYLGTRKARLGHEEQLFEEQMRGCEDQPAGPGKRFIDQR